MRTLLLDRELEKGLKTDSKYLNDGSLEGKFPLNWLEKVKEFVTTCIGLSHAEIFVMP